PEQISKPARGICAVPWTIGRTNLNHCRLRWPNTTPARVAFSAGLEPVELRRANFWATLIFQRHANTSNQFSIATPFINGAVECEAAFAYANSPPIWALSGMI